MSTEVAAQSVYYQDVLAGQDGAEPAWRDILYGPKELIVQTPTSSSSTPTSTISSASQLSTVIGASSSVTWKGRPTPSPPCHPLSPSSPSFPRRQFDNISVRSAPPLCRSSSTQMHPGCSPPTFMRHRRNLSTQLTPYSLKASASASAIFSKSPPMNRPQSLYVPFKGCVEPQPGRAARDILNALSFAPTQDSFSAETRRLALDEETAAAAEWSKIQQPATQQPSRSSWSYSPKLPCIPQSPKFKLRTKSSSMATLVIEPTSPKILRPRPRYPPNMYPDRPPPPYSQAIQKLPISYSTTDIASVPLSPVPVELMMVRPNLGSEFSDFVPIYSPTNPLNHAENIALLVTHPPVIHPPPDIVTNSPSPSNMGRNLSSPRGYQFYVSKFIDLWAVVRSSKVTAPCSWHYKVLFFIG